MKALVVEDDKALQVFYQHLLTKIGYQVTMVGDGEAALHDLNESAAPELIVLDMRLPGVNGLAVLEYIAQAAHLQSTHVVVTTAGKEFEQHTRRLPQAEFLLKPVSPAQVLEIATRVREQ